MEPTGLGPAPRGPGAAAWPPQPLHSESLGEHVAGRCGRRRDPWAAVGSAVAPPGPARLAPLPLTSAGVPLHLAEIQVSKLLALRGTVAFYSFGKNVVFSDSCSRCPSAQSPAEKGLCLCAFYGQEANCPPCGASGDPCSCRATKRQAPALGCHREQGGPCAFGCKLPESGAAFWVTQTAPGGRPRRDTEP